MNSAPNGDKTMKIKIFAAALAALALGSAASASAQDYRGGWRNDDWRGRQEIVVRQDGRTMSFDRGDRMFYRLTDRPFNFRPGLSYAYTDRCNRFGCQVIVYSPRAHRVVDSTFAPRLFDRGHGWDGGWDRDGRAGDPRFSDPRFNGRDNGFDGRTFDQPDGRLDGGPPPRR